MHVLRSRLGITQQQAQQPPISFEELAQDAQSWAELVTANNSWLRGRLQGEHFTGIDRESFSRPWINEIVRWTTTFGMLWQEMLEGKCEEELSPLTQQEQSALRAQGARLVERSYVGGWVPRDVAANLIDVADGSIWVYSCAPNTSSFRQSSSAPVLEVGEQVPLEWLELEGDQGQQTVVLYGFQWNRCRQTSQLPRFLLRYQVNSAFFERLLRQVVEGEYVYVWLISPQACSPDLFWDQLHAIAARG